MKKKDEKETCEKCGQGQAKKIMTIIDGPCWKCTQMIKIAYISSIPALMLRDYSNNLPPSKFTKDEADFARSKGAILKTQFSRTMEQSYLANTCNTCDTFAGNHHLFTDYISPAGYGQLQKEEYELGKICEGCLE